MLLELLRTSNDHLGSTNITTDANGTKISDIRYKAWGETRYQNGDPHTDKGYTGQRSYVSDFGLHYYNARWYDSQLGRFAQADTIVPGERKSSKTIDDVADNQYTVLTVGYYEVSVLEKLNKENAFILAKGGRLNLSRNDKLEAHIVGVPLNVQSFDRYAYSNNNPAKYTDPTGHLSWDEWLEYLTMFENELLPLQASVGEGSNWGAGIGGGVGAVVGLACLPSGVLTWASAGCVGVVAAAGAIIGTKIGIHYRTSLKDDVN